jgi:hypothetical protein
MLRPGPQYPPVVVALIPTNGTDDAEQIHELHMKFRKIAAELNMSIVACSGDGAASELSAQGLMDNEASDLEPLVYEYPAYGIHVKAPVFEKTGPLIPCQDPPHGRKTGRNQPQHGTKTASLADGFIVNRSLVDLFETGDSCLVRDDVVNVDKQDDGAARRFYHSDTFEATTFVENGVRMVRVKFKGLFVYLFILGMSCPVSPLIECYLRPIGPR